MEITYHSSPPLKSAADLLAISVAGDPTQDAFLKELDGQE